MSALSFRTRLAVTCAALALLAGVFLLGLLLPEGGGEARALEAPLLPLSSPAEIAEIEIPMGRSPEGGPLLLRRAQGGWEAREAREAGRVWPASSERAEALAALLAGLRRGRLVSSDPARRAELGLEGGGLLVLRGGPGRPELRLRIGSRAASGQEDYLGLEGQEEVYLVRGNLSVLLAQDRAYWLSLYVLPDEVRGDTIGRITVRGEAAAAGEPPIRGGYTLERTGEGWILDGVPADARAAQAMAEALARLEGQDLLEAGTIPAGTAGAAASGLEVVVSTLDGRAYTFQVRREGERLLLRLSGSPWVYPLNPRLLARAIRSAEELRAR